MEDDANRIARAGKLWRRTPRSKSRLLTDQGDLLCAAGSGPGISTVRSERQVRYRPSVVGGDNRLILTLLTADTSR
jgi:hypothetical protein